MIYALYHGDKFIDLGTLQYLAKKIGVSLRTMYYYSSPSYRKRSKGSGWIIIRIEEDDEYKC